MGCLMWAGSKQANRVRRRYLASLLSQARFACMASARQCPAPPLTL